MYTALVDDPTLAAIVTQLAREPATIEDVRFFLSARGDEPPLF